MSLPTTFECVAVAGAMATTQRQGECCMQFSSDVDVASYFFNVLLHCGFVQDSINNEATLLVGASSDPVMCNFFKVATGTSSGPLSLIAPAEAHKQRWLQGYQQQHSQ
jgi:hypothetical protein